MTSPDSKEQADIIDLEEGRLRRKRRFLDMIRQARRTILSLRSSDKLVNKGINIILRRLSRAERLFRKTD